MEGSTPSSRRKWLIRAAVAVVVLYGTYLVGANVILNTDLLRPVINRKPEKLLVEWRSGWSLLPGAVHVEGLRIRGQSKKAQWQLRVGSGTFRISLLSLPMKKVRVSRGHGTGFLFYIRRRLAPGEAARAEPEIEGLSNPPDPAPEDLYPPRPKRGRPWHVDVSRVRFGGPVDLWLYDLRVQGEGRVAGGVDYKIRSEIEVTRAALRLKSAVVTVSGDVLAHDLDLDVNAALTPFVPKETRGLDILGHFRGEIGLDSGRIRDLTVLNAFFPPGGGVKLLSGEGMLDLELSVESPREAAGRLDLVVAGARLLATDAEVSGDLSLNTVLQRGDLAAGRFDLGGTKVALEHMVLPDPKREGRDAGEEGEELDAEEDEWWMRLEVLDGTIVMGRPARVDITLGIEMKDTRPLLRMFLAKPKKKGEGTKVPGWAGMIPNIRDIEGEATLDLGPQGTIIDDVLISGTKMDMMARLKAFQGSVEGQLYLRYGALHLGVDLKDGKKQIKLSQPKQWFIDQPEYDDSGTLSPPPEPRSEP